jgi:ribosomal protein S18 acetylase RimI-like enzyme
MNHTIRQIEERSLNAWPSLGTLYFDGWILRFSEGYTRRANSVNPIYKSTLDVQEKIAACETFYTQKDLKTVFKLTPAVCPSDLDTVLAQKDYILDAPTSVQTVHLANVAAPTLDSVVVSNDLTDDWLKVFCRLNHIDPDYIPIMQSMLRNILRPCCFITLHYQDEIAAVALGVLDGAYVSVYDVVTAAHLRNRGLGRELMRHVLQWGKAHGASDAFLQVMLNNPPALHLYNTLGFREVYQYWYRMKDLRS